MMTVHQLKMTLESVRPSPWRRVLVPSDMTLLDLHTVISELFGWEDCHLHEFWIGGTRYSLDGEADWDDHWDDDGDPPLDEADAVLSRVAPQGALMSYQYDFGEDWRLFIEVEAVMSNDPRATFPRCVDGERAIPPEDVGGPNGYTDFLEAISDPLHKNHDEMLNWFGGFFDPEACDLAIINTRLAAAGPGNP